MDVSGDRPVRTASQPGGCAMSVAKVIEIISESPDSVEDAVRQGLERAAQTLDGIKGAWISETKVVTGPDGKITAWRVCMRVSFVIG